MRQIKKKHIKIHQEKQDQTIRYSLNQTMLLTYYDVNSL